MYFTNRYEAAQELAVHLTKYKSSSTLVLAIPRGGVPIGCVLAKILQAPLDLLMAKKIGYPGDPEYAIGAVCENEIIVDPHSGVESGYIAQEQKRIQQELKARYKILSVRDRPLSLQKKKVILTDDGIATGRTMLVAVQAARKQDPAELIVAVPVCSLAARERLEPEVDKLISCYYPDPFIGVGRFYRQFEQVTDQAVRAMLSAVELSNTPTSTT
jgi:predicted phosphoribosyltransferase